MDICSQIEVTLLKLMHLLFGDTILSIWKEIQLANLREYKKKSHNINIVFLLRFLCPQIRTCSTEITLEILSSSLIEYGLHIFFVRDCLWLSSRHYGSIITFHTQPDGKCSCINIWQLYLLHHQKIDCRARTLQS